MMAGKAVRPTVYLLLFALFTAIFLVVNFPQDQVAAYVNQWMKENAGNVLTAQAASAQFPLSIRLRDIELASGGRKYPVGDLSLSPTLASLVRERKSFSALLEGDWGTLPIDMAFDRERWEVGFNGDGIELSMLPAAPDLPIDLEGELSIDTRIKGTGGGKPVFSGEGSIHLVDAVVGGDALELFGVDEIKLTKVRLFWSAEDNLVTLQETGIEGDIMGDIGGTILVLPGNPGNSRVNLTLNLRPSLEAQDRIGPLMSLLGSKTGSSGGVRVTIDGTLGEPKFAL
jgi:type II secretion system protein N